MYTIIVRIVGVSAFIVNFSKKKKKKMLVL